MEFNISNGMWVCMKMEADGKDKYKFNCAGLQAPLKMSYHCGNLSLHEQSNKSTHLIFNQFQVGWSSFLII